MEEIEIQNEDLHLHHRIVVDPGQTPVRIDKFLLDKLEKISRNKIQNAIKAEAILVDEKTIKPNYKISPGEIITVVLPNPPSFKDSVKAEPVDFKIEYEDEDILIVNKPSGLVVHPGVGNHSGTLVNGLAHHFNSMDLPVMEGNLADRPGLVHRIDKETSGLLVIAKNEEAMSHLSKQFFNHTIEREYYALVWGNFDEPKGTIDCNIGRHPKDRIKQHAFPDGDEGKHAVTHYEVIEDLYYVSLVKCKLETGRTHQIRVHMNYTNHPVFNDSRYNGNSIRKGTVFSKYKHFVENCFKICTRQALHAKSLGFIHPRTKKEVFFESELPADMTEVLAKWNHYLANRKKHE
jgi:23S rRNA pseudouridine1911/1915/1917 synthase